MLTFVVMNVVVTAHRSLIPVAVDGTVTAIEVRPEKHPGVDDVWLVTIGERRLHVDAEAAKTLTPGSRLAKAAWARTLSVDARPLRLELSRDARAMLVVMPLIVLAAGLGLRTNRRSRQ